MLPMNPRRLLHAAILMALFATGCAPSRIAAAEPPAKEQHRPAIQLPHTSGEVVAVQADKHSFDIRPRIPADAPDGRIVQGILAFDSKKRRLADNGWEIYQTQGERDADPARRQPDGSLRVFQKKGTSLPDVKWEVVVRHQVYGFDALVFANCSRVLVEDVAVRAVPSMAVIGWGSRDLTIRRIKVVPLGEGWMSATADAMYFGACRGTITVEGSEFSGMGDDAINIHAMYGLAASRVDDRTLAIARGRFHPYQGWLGAGDDQSGVASRRRS